MKKIAIFGAGNYGKRAIISYLVEGKDIAFVVDNKEEKWGGTVLDVPIISPTKFAKEKDGYHLVIAVNVGFWEEIELQLKTLGVRDYEFFDLKKLSEKKRLISYSEKETLEDVILYHLFADENDIFYIDIGSNDPFEHSVTKLFYDMKAARGINVEPQRGFYELLQKERPRDINLCIGVGAKNGKMKFYYQGGYSTVIEENVKDKNCYFEEIEVVTLKSICEAHIDERQKISFLKIDVEGAEQDVLMGADFTVYRPEIVVVEATKPGTSISSYESWEGILISNHYHFVVSVGVNRYYVANEKSRYDERFVSVEELKKIYNIYHAVLAP